MILLSMSCTSCILSSFIIQWERILLIVVHIIIVSLSHCFNFLVYICKCRLSLKSFGPILQNPHPPILTFFPVDISNMYREIIKRDILSRSLEGKIFRNSVLISSNLCDLIIYKEKICLEDYAAIIKESNYLRIIFP